MPNLHEILQKIQRELYCPICGKNYENGEIRLRGLFDHTIILQTICINGHSTMFMTTYQKEEDKKAITSDDVLDLHNVLKEFNGDFEKLWSKSI